MLERAQYIALLKDGVIDKLRTYLEKFGLYDFSIVAPYMQSDKNKVNILTKEQNELDFHTSSTINVELQRMTGLEFYLHIEGDEDEQNVNFYRANAIPFNAVSIAKAFNEEYPLNYKVNVDESNDELRVQIVIKKVRGVNYDKGKVGEVYKTTTEQNFDPEHGKQTARDSSGPIIRDCHSRCVNSHNKLF
jgi:hypothetical protein